MSAPKRVNVNDGQHEECSVSVTVLRDRMLGGLVSLNLPNQFAIMVPQQARQVAMHLLHAAQDAEGVR